MNQRKLFFGIPVTGMTRKALVRKMEPWEGLPLFLTAPDNLHVTMFFIGSVEDADLPDICRIAAEAVAEAEPFDLEFSEIVLAPEDREADMIWLRGEPSEGALALRNALEHAFTSKYADNKRFRPHVTLARLRKNRWKMHEPKPAFPIPFVASESVASLTLFEVVSDEGKRKYVPIDEFPLG